MSNSGQNSYVSDLYIKIPIPAETSFKSFRSSYMTSKNDALTSVLRYFCQKSCCGDILPTPPLSIWFYCYYRPPDGGRSPTWLWSAVQRGASQDFNQFLVSDRARVWGHQVLSQASFLALSNRNSGAAPFWANSRNHSALWQTTQIPGDLVNARSKLNGPRYLTVLLDPGSIRVKVARGSLSMALLKFFFYFKMWEKNT
jgi:hypothetical protein